MKPKPKNPTRPKRKPPRDRRREQNGELRRLAQLVCKGYWVHQCRDHSGGLAVVNAANLDRLMVFLGKAKK